MGIPMCTPALGLAYFSKALGPALPTGYRAMHAVSPILLAAAEPLKTATAKPSPVPGPAPSTWGVGILVVVLLIGVPMAYRLWRKAHTEEEPADSGEMLADFEQAFAAGKMSETEFRRIRELVLGIPAAGAAGRKKAGPEVRHPLPGAPEPPTDAPAPLDRDEPSAEASS